MLSFDERVFRQFLQPFPFEGALVDCSDEQKGIWIRVTELWQGGAVAREYCKKDPEERDRWMLVVGELQKLLSRDRSDVFAVNLFACCQLFGRGTAQDVIGARQGFLDVGNLGLSSGWYNLGVLVASPRFGSPDYIKAIRYFLKGTQAGCPFCKNRLEFLSVG